MELLTVITISKNNSSGFKRTLDSVLKANLSSSAVKLLVVNGGSEWLLKRDIDDLSTFDSDQIEIITGQDRGIFNAMNIGLGLVSTPYVFFLNAGDVISAGLHFNSLTLEIQRKASNWMIANACHTTLSGDVRVWKQIKPLSLKHKLGLNSFPHHATIYKTDFILQNGGYFEDSPFADWELSLRLSQIELPEKLDLMLSLSEPFNHSASFSNLEWANFVAESRVRLSLASSRLHWVKVYFIFLLKLVSATKAYFRMKLNIE